MGTLRENHEKQTIAVERHLGGQVTSLSGENVKRKDLSWSDFFFFYDRKDQTTADGQGEERSLLVAVDCKDAAATQLSSKEYIKRFFLLIKLS